MTDPDEGNRPRVSDPVPPLGLPPVTPSIQGGTGPDNKPGLNDSQVIAQFLKPTGYTAWLQKDHAPTYIAKGYELTGDEFNIDAYTTRSKSWTSGAASRTPRARPGLRADLITATSRAERYHSRLKTNSPAPLHTAGAGQVNQRLGS
jgi:hypothetical protein